MSAARAVVNAGVCGFVTEILATADAEAQVKFDIESPCDNIRALAGCLPVVDAYSEIGAGFGGRVHEAARTSLKGCCSGCVVPNGIYKAMQIAAGLALPRAVSMEFERAEEHG